MSMTRIVQYGTVCYKDSIRIIKDSMVACTRVSLINSAPDRDINGKSNTYSANTIVKPVRLHVSSTVEEHFYLPNRTRLLMPL